VTTRLPAMVPRHLTGCATLDRVVRRCLQRPRSGALVQARGPTVSAFKPGRERRVNSFRDRLVHVEPGGGGAASPPVRILERIRRHVSAAAMFGVLIDRKGALPPSSMSR